MSTMPMNAGAYGQPELQDISQQRRFAEQLRQQGAEQLQGQMVSGHYVAPSWTQQLAKVLQSGMAGYYNSKADNAEKDYANTRNKKIADFMLGNTPRTTQVGTTDTSTMPAYTPEQQDQFGSPLPNVQREPVITSTPNMQTETPDQVQARQRQLAYSLASQYPDNAGVNLAIGDLNHLQARSEMLGDKTADRVYADNRENNIYARNRVDTVADRQNTQDFTSNENRLSRDQQAVLQQAGFSQAQIMQIAQQKFSAGQTANSQNFTAGQNQLARDQQLNLATAKTKNKGLSVAAQKELIEAEDGIQGSKQAIDAFKKAISINNNAMGGFGSSALATAGSVLPDFARPSTVDATKELDNVLQGSALPQLKAIFGGMPTEGERAILLEVQGSSAQPAKVREGIFKRAIESAHRRIEYNTQKSKQLRNGTYFTEEGGINVQDAPINNNLSDDAGYQEWKKANGKL